jgi:hypothetical protein
MRLIAFALLALSCCSAWAAQRVVMYRCTDANGAVIVQNDVPCPKGSKQVKRVIEAPSPAPVSATPAAPAPVLAPIAPAPPPPAPVAPVPKPEAAPAIAAERLPPPTVYRCLTYKKESYLSDTDIHGPQCVPLRATGLDGNPDTGAGTACEVVRDACERIPDDHLCEAWQQRLRDAEATLRFGKPEQAETVRMEFNRAEKVMRESTCGQ